jgi:hypothetical protein
MDGQGYRKERPMACRFLSAASSVLRFMPLQSMPAQFDGGLAELYQTVFAALRSVNR